MISSVPHERYLSDLPLQRVNDEEFYLALAMGTLKKKKKRFLCYICFLIPNGRRQAKDSSEGFF